MKLRYIQTEADKRDTMETNRILGLTIIEVIAKNWWSQYEKLQEAYIHDPANGFDDAKKEQLAEDLITDMSWVFKYLVDLRREMQKLTKQHVEIINQKMVKKLFDQREPFVYNFFPLSFTFIL